MTNWLNYNKHLKRWYHISIFPFFPSFFSFFLFSLFSLFSSSFLFFFSYPFLLSSSSFSFIYNSSFLLFFPQQTRMKEFDQSEELSEKFEAAWKDSNVESLMYELLKPCLSKELLYPAIKELHEKVFFFIHLFYQLCSPHSLTHFLFFALKYIHFYFKLDML